MDKNEVSMDHEKDMLNNTAMKYSESDLKEQINEILKDADIERVSSKDIRLKVQETLGIDLEPRKKEFDRLVVEIFNEREELIRNKIVKPIVSAKKRKK